MTRILCSACLFDVTVSEDGAVRYAGPRCPVCRRPFVPLVIDEASIERDPKERRRTHRPPTYIARSRLPFRL